MKRLGDITDVTEVEDLFTDELLLFKVCAVKVFVLQLALQNPHLAEVKGHVRGKDGADDLLADPLVLLW